MFSSCWFQWSRVLPYPFVRKGFLQIFNPHQTTWTPPFLLVMSRSLIFVKIPGPLKQVALYTMCFSWYYPPGIQHSCGKSPCLMEKSTINGHCPQQTVSHYQRVCPLNPMKFHEKSPINPIKSPLNHHQSPLLLFLASISQQKTAGWGYLARSPWLRVPCVRCHWPSPLRPGDRKE